jgi:hypothetical protein
MIAATPQKPVEEKPTAKPPVKSAEKAVVKPAAKTEVAPVVEAPKKVESANSPEFLDVTAAGFIARRIPDIKLDSAKPHIAAETSSTVAVSGAENGFFSISRATIDYITKGLIVLGLVLVVVILRMRDRKKRRRVFRVKNR